MKYLITIIATFFSLPVLAHGHMSFKNNTVHVHATFQSPPEVSKEAFLILEIKDVSTHQTIEIGDDVEVVLWMPSMNHGSAPTQVERAVDAEGNIRHGVYFVRNIYFIMGGDWEVRVTLTDLMGQPETKSFSLVLEGGSHGGHH
jgi:hypothetical protein